MAAVVATKLGSAQYGNSRGKHRTIGHRTSEHDEGVGSTVIGLATCVGGILVCVGTSFFVSALDDVRSVLLDDYDAGVAAWTSTERPIFADAKFNVVAKTTRIGGNTSHKMTTTLFEENSFINRDSERGEGILDYVALKFISNFQLQGYFPANASASSIGGSQAWSPLPARDEAPVVTFEFSAGHGSGSPSNSKFATSAFPVFYDEIAPTITPAPESKCRVQQRGTWRHGRCHVVKRLDRICLQVKPDGNGGWQLHNKELDYSSNSAETHYTKQRYGPLPSFPNQTYGCDPRNRWTPAMYKVDQCWGARRLKWCSELNPDNHSHRIEVMVRSWSDPYIRAEELTDDSFDFGLSPGSRKTYGALLFLMGALLCIMPLCRLFDVCYRRYRHDRDDSRSLKYCRDDVDLGIGTYGNPSPWNS